MPAAMVMTVVTADVSGHQPLHPPAEITVLVRPQNQVKMIGHQAMPDQSHGYLVMRLPHQVNERKKVFRLVEDIIACVPSIENVINVSTL